MDFVEIRNVCAGKAIIEAAKRIIISDWVCRSYSDLNFGVTFLEHSVYFFSIPERKNSDVAFQTDSICDYDRPTDKRYFLQSYLLTYSDTERALRCSRRRLRMINMGFSDEYRILIKNEYIFTALHGMQTRSSDENSVCPSVKRVDCVKAEVRCVQIFIPYERIFS